MQFPAVVEQGALRESPAKARIGSGLEAPGRRRRTGESGNYRRIRSEVCSMVEAAHENAAQRHRQLLVTVGRMNHKD
jgi:hypothetical protein